MSSSPPSKPPSHSRAPGNGGFLGALVRVEKLIQLALFLPAATFAGWAIGYGLDRWLHQQWIYLVGLVLGVAAGFVEVFRVVLRLNRE